MPHTTFESTTIVKLNARAGEPFSGRLVGRLNSISNKFCISLLFVLLLVSTAQAIQFKITKVVALPKESYDARWSPEGDKIALIARSHDTSNSKIIPTLILVDTLGHSDIVFSFGTTSIHQWVWLSPDEIVLHTIEDSAMNTIHKLLRLNILSKSIEEIKAYRNVYLTTEPDSSTKQKYPWMRKNRQVPDGPMFDGPFTGGYGSAYIIHDKMNLFGEYRREQIISNLFELNPDSINWIIVPTKQGVYKINAVENDSVLLTSKIKEPAIAYGIDLLVSENHKYVVRGGAIVETATDRLVFMDTIITEIPKGTGACGYHPLGFNPIFDELILHRSCDDGHNYGVSFTVVVDLNSYQWSYIDSSLNHPLSLLTYSPDGTKFAYASGDSLYIVARDTL